MTLEEVMQGLVPEDVDQEVELGDQNAPELGSFPPRLKVGETYVFKFHLAERKEDTENPQRNQPFAFVEREWPPDSGEKRKFLQVIWTAEVDPALQPDKFTALPDGSTPSAVKINFNRAIAYKHPKMQISEMGDLLRCLGKQIDEYRTVSSLIEVLQELDGAGATGRFVAGRDAFFPDNQEFTTARPGKAREYQDHEGNTVKIPAGLSWPRNGDGTYPEAVTYNGQTLLGRDMVQTLKKPVPGA